jgi:hypothetical protein
MRVIVACVEDEDHLPFVCQTGSDLPNAVVRGKVNPPQHSPIQSLLWGIGKRVRRLWERGLGFCRNVGSWVRLL